MPLRLIWEGLISIVRSSTVGAIDSGLSTNGWTRDTRQCNHNSQGEQSSNKTKHWVDWLRFWVRANKLVLHFGIWGFLERPESTFCFFLSNHVENCQSEIAGEVEKFPSWERFRNSPRGQIIAFFFFFFFSPLQNVGVKSVLRAFVTVGIYSAK